MINNEMHLSKDDDDDDGFFNMESEKNIWDDAGDELESESVIEIKSLINIPDNCSMSEKCEYIGHRDESNIYQMV